MFYYVNCLNKKSHGFFIKESNKKSKGHFVSNFKSTFSNKISNSISRDLVRIGEGIFLCDRAFTRSKTLGLKTRELKINIPVENRELFVGLKDKYDKWASFITHDVWDINFINFRGVKQDKFKIDLPNKPTKSIVSLFSDGLDSLCGAVYSLKKGENPVFVSHSPPGFNTVEKNINELKNKLGYKDADIHIANFYFTVSDRNPENNRRNMFQERSRRSRPILYLSFAAAVAIELGISTIRLNENGYMAINLPITGFKKGVDISRHAHPETIKLFEDILNELNPNDNMIKIENPFFNYTKTQQVKILKDVSELIDNTKSCEYGRQQIATVIRSLKKNKINATNIKECGLCIPCLVRRIAISGNDFGENNNRYAFHISHSALKNAKVPSLPLINIVKDNALHLMEFCEAIRNMTINEFTRAYFYELSLLYRNSEDLTHNLPQIFKLHKTFANEFLNFVSKN